MIRKIQNLDFNMIDQTENEPTSVCISGFINNNDKIHIDKKPSGCQIYIIGPIQSEVENFD